MRLLLGAFGSGDHSAGRSFSRETPFCSGPRQKDQSAARTLGTKAATANNRGTMRRFMGGALGLGPLSVFGLLYGRAISSPSAAPSSRSAASLPMAPAARQRERAIRRESPGPRAPPYPAARRRAPRSRCATSAAFRSGPLPGDTRPL